LELAKSLADPEGIVDRAPLREKAVVDEIAKDVSQVKDWLHTLESKKLIKIIDTKQIRLLDQP
jgi:hypothetical protein